MPPGFEFPTSEDVELWTPLAFNPNDAHGRSRRARSLLVVGRMAPGSSAEQAQQELNVVAALLEAANAASYQDLSRRYIAELNKPRIRLPAIVGFVGAVGVGLVVGRVIP